MVDCDKIVSIKENPMFNPFSDFIKPLQNGTLPSEVASLVLKTGAYFQDIYNVDAYDSDCRPIRLGTIGANLKDVDRVGGVWRVQNKFPYTITNVRGKDFVLTHKLNRVENTYFEFWAAKAVGYNCYGPFISKSNECDYIVAKYETDDGVRMAYGKTLDAARAYLGMKLYDETKDIINGILCKNKLKEKS